jgi:hypothetical protein
MNSASNERRSGKRGEAFISEECTKLYTVLSGSLLADGTLPTQ